MRAAAAAISLVILATAIVTNGQVISKTRVNESRAHFITVGEMSAGENYGHLGTELDFNKIIENFNHLVTQMDNVHMKSLHNAEIRSQARLINGTMRELHAQINEERERLRMICWTLGCEVPVKESTQNPTIWKKPMKLTPQQLLRDFYLQNRKNRTARGLIDTGIALSSFGLSLYTLHEVKTLHNQLFKQGQDIGHMAEIMNLNAMNIQEGGQQIQTIRIQIEKMCNFTTRTQFQLDRQAAVEYLQLFASNLAKNVDGIESMLIHRKITFSFFDLDHVTKALKKIKSLAAKNNLKLANDHPSSILQESLSYISQEGKLSFIIHLQLVEREMVQLYQFINTPILLNEGFYIQPKVESEIFGVNPSNDRFFILSESTLARCTKTNLVYSCPNTIELREPKRTCIGALYEGQSEFIRAYCSITEWEVMDEFIMPIESDTFLTIIPPKHRITAEISCPIPYQDKMSPISPLLLSGMEEIVIPRGCLLTTGRYTIKVPKSHQIRQSFITRKLHEFSNYFEENIFKSRGIQNILSKEFHPYVAPKPFVPTSAHEESSWGNELFIIIPIFLIAVSASLLPGLLLYLKNRSQSQRPSRRRQRDHGPEPRHRDHSHRGPSRQRGSDQHDESQRQRHQRLHDQGGARTEEFGSSTTYANLDIILHEDPEHHEGQRGLGEEEDQERHLDPRGQGDEGQEPQETARPGTPLHSELSQGVEGEGRELGGHDGQEQQGDTEAAGLHRGSRDAQQEDGGPRILHSFPPLILSSHATLPQRQVEGDAQGQQPQVQGDDQEVQGGDEQGGRTSTPIAGPSPLRNLWIKARGD